jgi:hypothetical protein
MHSRAFRVAIDLKNFFNLGGQTSGGESISNQPTHCAQGRIHSAFHVSPGLTIRHGKHKYFLVFAGNFWLSNARR